MRILMLVILILIGLGVGGCGGTDNDNPPQVAGLYTCVGNCIGTCSFETSLNVTQTGASVIASTSTTSCSGSVDNEGTFGGECETGPTKYNCDGSFAGGQFIANCVIEGTDCQKVTYSKQ